MEEAKKTLLAALRAEGLKATTTGGKKVKLPHKFIVEVEGPSLFKLLDDGHLVTPFSNAKELAGFVRMDLIQRGLGLD